MLKKVLKYDLQRIYKFLIIFYIITVSVAIITRLITSFESVGMMILGQFFNGLTISAVINIVINNFMRVWVIFKEEYYGDESYLRHTLPVEKGTLYISKIITTLVTVVTSTVVVVGSLIIADTIEFVQLKDLATEFAVLLDTTEFMAVTMLIVEIMCQFLAILFSGYTGIIIGHKFNSGRIGRSVLWGFICYMATQALMIASIFIVGLFDSDVMKWFTETAVSPDITKKFFVIVGVAYLCFSVIFMLIDIKLLKKGVDVE